MLICYMLYMSYILYLEMSYKLSSDFSLRRGSGDILKNKHGRIVMADKMCMLGERAQYLFVGCRAQ